MTFRIKSKGVNFILREHIHNILSKSKALPEESSIDLTAEWFQSGHIKALPSSLLFPSYFTILFSPGMRVKIESMLHPQLHQFTE